MPTKSAPRLQGRRTGEVSDQHLPDQLAPYGEGAKRRVPLFAKSRVRHALTEQMSIKRFVAALDCSGMAETALRRWLGEYDGPGQHNRQSRGENNLSVAYARDHELGQLELICRLAGVDPRDIATASEAARLAGRTPAQAKIFRDRLPWTVIAPGLHAFVEKCEAHVGIESARRLQSEAEEAFRQLRIPDETEVMQMATRRIGQNVFRHMLLQYWNQRCPISGISDPRLLRASHIKPWGVCENHERLSPFNGILLSANLDAAFDAGLISFSNDGAVLRSDLISNANFVALGVGSGTQLSVTLQHNPFLGWHRREHGYCSD
jgi:hypothetical protein